MYIRTYVGTLHKHVYVHTYVIVDMDVLFNNKR